MLLICTACALRACPDHQDLALGRCEKQSRKAIHERTNEARRQGKQHMFLTYLKCFGSLTDSFLAIDSLLSLQHKDARYVQRPQLSLPGR